MFILGCASPSIVVKQKVQSDLRTYRAAYVVSQSDDRTAKHDRFSGRGDPYLNDKICDALNAIGVAQTVDERKADLRVDCNYRRGWSLPYTGRHYDVFFTSIRTVRIKLIDKVAQRTIGDVEYRRSRLTRRPPEGFVGAMFSAMIGTAGASTNTPNSGK